jgi:ribosome-interacting GTPase 1
MKDIIMVYKTYADHQKVESLVSFLRAAGIEIIRSPQSVVASALDRINGTCLFVHKDQEKLAKEMIDEYFNEEPEFVDLPDELKYCE